MSFSIFLPQSSCTPSRAISWFARGALKTHTYPQKKGMYNASATTEYGTPVHCVGLSNLVRGRSMNRSRHSNLKTTQPPCPPWRTMPPVWGGWTSCKKGYR